MKLSSRKELLNHADDVLNKLKIEHKQQLTEGKITNTVKLLRKMAEKEVQKRFNDIKQFMDIEKIKGNKPDVSINNMENILIKSAIEINSSQKIEGKIDESFSSFINNIKDTLKQFIKKTTGFIEGLSKIPGMIGYLKYVKNPKGFIDYYSNNMTKDGIVYSGITDDMINSFRTNVKEGILNDPQSISIVLSLMFFGILTVVALWTTLRLLLNITKPFSGDL